MSGHGHVTPNENGSKARCGGPALCSTCAKELAEHQEKIVERQTRPLASFYQPVRELCTDKGWRDDEPGKGPRTGHQFAAYLMLGVSEFSEALESYRDKIWSDTCNPIVYMSTDRSDHHPGCSGKAHAVPKPVGVGPELADVFIRLIDMADVWGVDLDEEVARVMAYGWTRSYRHGGREL